MTRTQGIEIVKNEYAKHGRTTIATLVALRLSGMWRDDYNKAVKEGMESFHRTAYTINGVLKHLPD